MRRSSSPEGPSQTRFPCPSHLGFIKTPPEEASDTYEPFVSPSNMLGQERKIWNCCSKEAIIWPPLGLPSRSQAGGKDTQTSGRHCKHRPWSPTDLVQSQLCPSPLCCLGWTLLLHKVVMKIHSERHGKCAAPNLSHYVRSGQETSAANFIYCKLYLPRI